VWVFLAKFALRLAAIIFLSEKNKSFFAFAAVHFHSNRPTWLLVVLRADTGLNLAPVFLQILANLNTLLQVNMCICAWSQVC
jgi:hypothetical protein